MATTVQWARINLANDSQDDPSNAMSPIPGLRRGLSLLINLTDLELVVSFSAPLSLFNGVQFPQLVTLKTNVSHKALARLLIRNPTVQHLILLTSCKSAAPCALADVELPLITEITCGYSCLPSTLPVSVRKLVLFDPLPLTSSTSLLSTREEFPLPYLTALELEVAADDLDVLKHIQRGVPNVNRLKLVEQPAAVSSVRIVHRPL